MIVLIHTDLPEPVEPATSKCGILLKSAVIILPLISLPKPIASLPEEFLTASQSTTSLKNTVSFFNAYCGLARYWRFNAYAGGGKF